MIYVPTTWKDGETPVDAKNLNKIEEALKTLFDMGLDKCLKSVNGIFADSNGNVEIKVSGGNVDEAVDYFLMASPNGTVFKVTIADDGTLKVLDVANAEDFFDSWRGLISPMDGTFQQAYYNNGVAVDDKIYFIRNYGHSHYNGDNIYVPRWFCYDTKTNTTTCSTPTYDGKAFGCSSLWKGSDGAIYGFGYPYRYKTTDCGVTWTREQMTSPQYDPCPVYKLSNGRIIGTMLARTRNLMISDDEGLTWRTITPFTNEVYAEAGISGGTISPSHGTVCELDDCLVLYFNSPMEVDNTSKRYVSLSYDNGDTWSVPVACSGDLANAGWYISPGGLIKFGDKYHYFVSNRYKNTAHPENENRYLVGDLKWYIGTAEDVKNGTMMLKKVLSETLCTKSGFDATMAAQDVGNSGVTLCDGALYVNHGNLVYNKDDDTRVYVSNSGIEMFRIGMTDETDAAPYWDANFKDKYQTMLTEASTDYNYYFYAPDNTNINAVDWWGYESSGYLPNEGVFKLPLGTGNFEINGIVNCGYLSLTRSYPNILAGIEEDGTLHAIGNYGTAVRGIFDKANDNVPSGVLAGGSKTYFTFKRKDGVDTYTINGVTVTNPPFGWTFKTDYVLLDVTEPSFVYNINADDAAVQTWLDSKPQEWNISGFSMLTVKCDADYHGTTKENSITYNLTNCISSNTVTGINDGKKYETTISAIAGYEIESIICTMGGVQQPVTDGVISIESVAGDIVITATAKEITKDFTITYNLSNCTSSNNLPAIDEGESYSTTVTPISGYRFESISCTMGGVEQTVTDGVINIASATGNIVITAVAAAIPLEPVTNGLSMSYTMDSYDAGSNTWTDECGVGNAVTPKSYNADINMVFCEAAKLMTMQKFSSLFSAGWSVSMAVYVNSLTCCTFALNALGGTEVDPYAYPKYFRDSASNMIGHAVERYTKHHYVYTYDAEANTYTAYMDGVKMGTAEKTTAWNTNTSTHFMVGGWGNSFGNIRVYNRALTDAEVQQNYVCDSQKWTFDA